MADQQTNIGEVVEAEQARRQFEDMAQKNGPDFYKEYCKQYEIMRENSMVKDLSRAYAVTCQKFYENDK